MLVARINSVMVPKVQFGKLSDGFYENFVNVDLQKARESGDPKGYVQKEIARHLAGCVKHTDIPLGFSCWRVEFTVQARNMFGFPDAFTH